MQILQLNKQKLQEEENIRNPLLYFYKNSTSNYFDVLPFSTAIEIECDFKDSFNEKVFENIPFLISSSVTSEIAVRFDRGIKGMISLYLVAEYLKLHAEINPLSGIHVHVDFTDCYDAVLSNHKKEDLNDKILNFFDSWNTSSGQKRNVGYEQKLNWINFRKYYKTMEIRICDMTFEYIELLERLHSACYISNIVKKEFIQDYEISNNFIKEESIDKLQLIKYFKQYALNHTSNSDELNRLLNLKEEITKPIVPIIKDIQKSLNEIKLLIKSRVK